MKILFIGGTKFIGRRVAALLAGAGHSVTVFHRGKTTHPLPDDVQHIHGDIADLDDYRDTFKALAPDAVVHTRLMEQGDATQMMRVFRGIAGRVVVISSADVYRAWGRLLNTEPGDPLPVPLTETSPLREENYPYRNELNKDWRYYYDKIMVERIAMKMRKPPAVVVRLPMVYGEYDYQKRLAPYLQRMQDGREVILLDQRAAGWVAPRAYIDNVAHAILLATTHPDALYRIYHIGQPPAQAMTETEWVRAIGEVVGWEGRVVAAPPEMLPKGMRLNPHGQDITLDSSRIRQELGYQPQVSIPEGLRRTIAWDQQHTLPALPPIGYGPEDAIIQALGKK